MNTIFRSLLATLNILDTRAILRMDVGFYIGTMFIMVFLLKALEPDPCGLCGQLGPHSPRRRHENRVRVQVAGTSHVLVHSLLLCLGLAQNCVSSRK